MQYDGSGKLAEAIADLFGLSPKSQEQVAKRIKEAKTGLGITSKAKVLPDDVKRAIYQWHYDRLNPVQDVKQTDNANLDLSPDSAIQNVKQDAPVQLDDDIDTAVYDFKQIHFAVMFAHKGHIKRTTIMLEGYLVKALQRKHNLTDNPAIRVWIEQSIKNDGARFDSDAPLTRQVKRIIIESLV
ncbi:MAG: hypothetical protein M0Q44_22210 [Methylobacter sp.]|jgi:hypothetical protein|nr:hypothetical protein [Methylobacter sp.]